MGDTAGAPATGLTARYARFNRNVIASVLARGATLISGLIAASVLARGLGVTLYGLWALATTFMSYLALVDLGVSGGLVKLAGEANAKGDRDALSNYTAIAAVFYSVIGIALIGLMFLLRDPTARLLGVPPELRPEAGLLFTTAVVLLMVNNLVAIYQGTVSSVEAIHLNSMVLLVTAAGNLAAAVVLEGVLRLGAEAVLLGMVVASALTVIISMVLYAAVCHPTHWLPHQVSRSTLRSMATFGAGIQVSQVATVVNSSIDKFILSGFVGLSATAIFDLGARPSLLTSSVSWLIATAAYPALIRVAADERQSLVVFRRLETFQQVAACALAGILIALARPFVDLWLGPRYESVVPVLQVLAIARCGLVLTNLSTVAHWARGRTRDTMVFAVGRLVTHIVCSVVLVWRFGLTGALIGAMLAFWIPSAWFVHRTGKVLGVPVRPWAMEFLKVAAATTAATVVALLAGMLVDRVPLVQVVRWLLEGATSAALYVLVLAGLLLLLRVVTLVTLLSFLRGWRRGRAGEGLA